jgi:DNA polymerase III delta subunit
MVVALYGMKATSFFFSSEFFFLVNSRLKPDKDTEINVEKLLVKLVNKFWLIF